MPSALQFVPELGKVIYLAIEDNPNRAIFITQGLMATLQINDAEASVPKTRTRPKIETLAVRTTMCKETCDGHQVFAVHWFGRFVVPHSRNSTHEKKVPADESRRTTKSWLIQLRA
jgi:hypothetical protein